MHDFVRMPSHRAALATSAFTAWTASMALIKELATAVHEFIAPSYRPELHFMRGPGPACERRAIALRSRQYTQR